jgi:hypothetical protein
LDPLGGPNLDTKGVQPGHPIKEEKKNKTPEDSTTPTRKEVAGELCRLCREVGEG